MVDRNPIEKILNTMQKVPFENPLSLLRNP